MLTWQRFITSIVLRKTTPHRVLLVFLKMTAIILAIATPAFSQESPDATGTINTSEPSAAATPAEQMPGPDRTRRTTSLEWTPVPKAKSYDIEITPIGRVDGNKTPYLFSVEAPSWEDELKPGKYSMRLRSRDRRNVPGEWSPPEFFQVKLYAPKLISPLAQDEIKSPSAELHTLNLKWEEQSEASLYKIHISDESKTFTQNLETTKNELTLKVPVARKYQWSIVGFDKQGHEGESLNAPVPFTIIGKPLQTPRIMPPETSFVRQLNWEASPHAEKYTYVISRRDKVKNRKWSKFQEGETTNTALPFNTSWKGGEYRLSVTAHGKLRNRSKTHSLIFDVSSGYRSIAAEKRATLRKSIIRTDDWYFIASYFFTQIQYQSVNGDKEAESNFSAVGGTGRVGMGYFSTNNPYGFLGILDFSGFTIDSKTYKYPSAEAHGTFRLASDALGEVRVSGGLYLKSLPEVIGQSSDDFTVKSLDAFGVHGGGEYWYPLSSRLGLQINGRIYYPIGGKTPTGASIVPSPSLQFGVLGSLRLNNKATGLMGYAYRKDQTIYKVTESTSLANGYKTNTSSVVGHYLNFLLEWDL